MHSVYKTSDAIIEASISYVKQGLCQLRDADLDVYKHHKSVSKM